MCKAKNLIEELKGTSNKINDEYKRLKELLSKYDKELSEMYHNLETKLKMNASEGYFVAKELRDLLQKRRIVKNELEYYKSIRDTLNISSINVGLNRAKHNIDRLQKKHADYTQGWNIQLDDVIN